MKSNCNKEFFKKIDTKEKAYILGFILGDGSISNNTIEVAQAIADSNVVEYIASYVGSNVQYDHTYEPKTRRFPRCRTAFKVTQITNDVVTKLGNKLKKGRHFPIVSKELKPYLLLGFFDADGRITFGYRKDRDRLWQKVSFTADQSILQGVQQYLLDNDISTKVFPKSNEDTSVLEISNELNVYRIMQLLPLDFSPLIRKCIKFNEWLVVTKNKYTFQVGDTVTAVDKRTLKNYNIPNINFKINKDKIVSLEGNLAKLQSGVTCHTIYLSKMGISNMALRLELGEFGGRSLNFNTEPSLSDKEGVETTGVPE